MEKKNEDDPCEETKRFAIISTRNGRLSINCSINQTYRFCGPVASAVDHKIRHILKTYSIGLIVTTMSVCRQQSTIIIITLPKSLCLQLHYGIRSPLSDSVFDSKLQTKNTQLPPQKNAFHRTACIFYHSL